MNDTDKQSTINKIISGKIICAVGGKKYTISLNIDRSIIAQSQAFYDEIINEYKYEDWLSENEIPGILISRGLWNPDSDSNLEKLTKQVDDLKVEVYKNFFNTSKQKIVRKQLEMVRKKIDEMYTTRHSLDSFILHNFAHSLKYQWTLLHSIDGLTVDDVSTFSYKFIDIIASKVAENFIDNATLRLISRTEPWQSMYKVDKNNLFGLPSILLTNDQKQLILYSSLYENVYNHPEAPTESVIEDDDALDGWMITQSRKQKAEKAGKGADNILGANLANAQEVFIPAHSRQDLERIAEANTLEAQMIKKQRQAIIQEKGEVTDLAFPDKQMEIRNQNKG